MGNRIWHKVFELPEIEIPEEGLPQIEIEKEFEAQVPYEITTWDEYVDLREISNIEQKVVEEYKRVRQMIAEKKINELAFLPRNRCYIVSISKRHRERLER